LLLRAVSCTALSCNLGRRYDKAVFLVDDFVVRLVRILPRTYSALGKYRVVDLLEPKHQHVAVFEVLRGVVVPDVMHLQRLVASLQALAVLQTAARVIFHHVPRACHVQGRGGRGVGLALAHHQPCLHESTKLIAFWRALTLLVVGALLS